MEKTVFRNTYDMFVRPNTSDDLVCDEAQDYKNLFIDVKPYDVLLDVGANIGAVSKMAKNIEPNLTVIGYEPDLDNFDVLYTNILSLHRTIAINKALGAGDKQVKFYKSKGSNKGKHSKIKRKGSDSSFFMVDQIDFMNEIIENNATLLKIDIEGGEYDLDLNLPSSVKGLAIEFHLINNNYGKMLDLYKSIKRQFGLVLGEIPEEESIEFFEQAYDEENSAFMCIFLRNEE